ncbi:MAG: type I-E CRISPR-associated protein Cas5/CasD [Propionibacteriaceae bacterium]|jgi:CRISPR system Cascade subunit CasD|nr:type I-E CRISPR-associated protein Cas5/CasD [Propionibacteriaceae bacterium]
MTTLLLRLAGPLQAWGDSSRFTRRSTDKAPTKSGIIGLLAAAQGLRRTDPLEDLLLLQFGVRLDQPGQLERDFQTTHPADGKDSLPLTERFYLADAIFLAAVSGESDLITGLDYSLRHPAFPLYLGRRSCPPAGPVTLGTRPAGLWEALHDEPWQAASWWRRRNQGTVRVELRLDAQAVPVEAAHTFTDQHDAPVSFDSCWRDYNWRQVAHAYVELSNPDARDAVPRHDPMSVL